MGQIFRSAREALRLSQHQVAALTRGGPGELSRTLISAIERGRSLPGLQTLVSLARVLNVEPMEIVECIDVAMASPVDLGGRSALELRELGRECLHSKRYREALAVFDVLSEHLRSDPPHDERAARLERARLEGNRSLALRHCGALKAAQAAAQRSVELAREDPELLAIAYMGLANVLALQGLHVLAGDASHRALGLADELSLARQCQAWNQHGHVLHSAGDAERARKAFLRALELAVRARDRHHRIRIEGNIGSCLWDLGRSKQARSRFARAVRLAGRSGDPASEASWLIELGRLDFEQGEMEEAERRARSALALAGSDGEPLTQFRAQWLLHRIVRKRDAEAPDRQRLAHLRRLWTRLQAHRGVDVIAEFEKAVIEPARRRRREE